MNFAEAGFTQVAVFQSSMNHPNNHGVYRNAIICFRNYTYSVIRTDFISGESIAFRQRFMLNASQIKNDRNQKYPRSYFCYEIFNDYVGIPDVHGSNAEFHQRKPAET